MHVDAEQLKRFVLDSGLVSAEEFAEGEKKAKQGKEPIGKVLVSMGFLSENDLRRIEAHILGLPFIDLHNQKIDFEVLNLIPEPIARKHNIVAYKRSEEALEVAMLDTRDLTSIDFIRKKTGLKILPRLTNEESMKDVLVQYQKDLKSEFGDILKQEADLLKTIEDKGDEAVNAEELKKGAEELPVVRVVDTLLKHAIIQGASDVHIEPFETELIVRYRIDGILHDAMVLPKNAAGNIVARIKVLSNLKLDEKRLPQDGRFKVKTETEKVSIRVSVLPTYFGEKVVMRLLRESATGFTLEKLGFNDENLERLHYGINQATGMILVTGPTGSGKSTTLYTILDILNTPEVNISTVEDPVEYQMPRVNQTQVKPQIGFSFAEGLRSLMRQDPDIIMVGEIRDQETVSLAVNAALTGHLVLSTLHTNSAAGSFPRMIDMGIEPFLLASTVKVVAAQRLVRRLCKDREEYTITKEQMEQLSDVIDSGRMLKLLVDHKIVDPATKWEEVKFFRPVESKECEEGYSGRVGIHEVLKVTPAMRDLISAAAPTEDIDELARKEGMISMLEDGVMKAAQGLTSLEEVLRVVSE